MVAKITADNSQRMVNIYDCMLGEYQMDSQDELIAMVSDLINSENKCDRKAAAAILAEKFIAITRSSGREDSRDALLAAIEHPANPGIVRTLGDDVRQWRCGDGGVVRSVVTTVDSSAPEKAPKRFHNLHVFQRHDGQWRCVCWQVTALA